MQLTSDQLENGATRLALDGRLDVAGSGAIETKFNVLVGSKPAIVVDLSKVSFMASLGIRLLVIGAKTMAARKARMVLLSPDPNVENVLKTAGIDTLIPIYHDLAAASAAAAG